MKLSYRVKHLPAQTVYAKHCSLGDTTTLTMPRGVPLSPRDARVWANAERRDEPERWEIECRCSSGLGFVLSTHRTKEEARAALLAARRSGAGKVKATEILRELGGVS
jgi:hypothetical protein